MKVVPSGRVGSGRIRVGRLIAILAMVASVVAALPFTASAQDDDLWRLESPGLQDGTNEDLPDQFQAASLNRSAMAAALATAPLQDSAAAGSNPLELTLPTPDGGFERFAVEEAIVLSDSLAAQYPQIKSYRGQGIDDPTSTVVFTQTPLGFKAQVRANSSNWYVTPQNTDGTTTDYMSFTEANMPGDSDFSEPALEEFKAGAQIDTNSEDPVDPIDDHAAATPTGTQLRQHRLQISTTGAYSAQFGDNDVNITASVTNLVTFLNGIYEPELTVRFVLAGVAIFKEPTPRPATAGCVNFGPTLTIQSIQNLGAVFIRTTTPHNLAVGDAIVITGSDPLINGDQTVLQLSGVTPTTAFWINDGSIVTPAFTGTLQKKDLVIDPPYCDPFVFGNPSTNLSLNQPVADGTVGDANYDIGHVLGFLGGGGSGVAAVGVVGETGSKARGASHSSDVANAIPGLMHNIIRHELGHQYGSSHTFNGNRGNCGPQWGGPVYSVEPGSGSTIMSYGGICQGDNIVNVQDTYFSAISLEKFNDQLATVGLTGGAATGNNPPVVTTTGPWTVPAQTPFTLMGAATDDAADAGNLTYVWEQMDLATVQNQYELPNVDTGPLFRSLPPSAAGANRTLPSMDKILVNNTNANTGTCPGVPPTTSNPNSPVVQCFVEFLPTSAGLTANRTMNFRLTARDNRANGGGVGSADTTVTVVDGTGPMLVTSPNTAVTWAGNSNQTVTWNVAGTNLPPIAAANVDIAVSTDGGTSWTTVLGGTPNDGTQAIAVPNVATTQARVRVMGSGNIFFDISDVNFTITAGAVDEFTALAAPCLLHDTVAAGLGPLVPGIPRTVQVTGACTVPAGASSAVIGLSAINPTGVGNLRLSAAGVVPDGGVVNYTINGLNNANTVTVPLSAAGAVDVASNSSPTDARLVVIGYYSAAGTLKYVPLTPCTVADSRTGVNPAAPPFAGPFAGGAAYPDIDVVGTFSANQGGGNTDCNVPAGASAVVINAVAIQTTGGAGGLALGTGGTNPTENTTNFANLALNNSAVAIVPMAGGQTVALNITTLSGTPSTHVRLVVMGYMSAAIGQDYIPVNPCAAFDSRTTVPGDTNIPTGVFAGKRDGGSATAGTIPGTTTYNVTGAIPAAQGGELACGIPTGVSAVLINLVAIDPNAAGNFRAYATGTTPTGGVLNFSLLVPAVNNSNAITVPVDANGDMDLFVNAPSLVGVDAVHARGVILGYYN